MFLGLLNPEQHAVFCRVALHVMRANSVIDQREANFLEAAVQEMGLDELPEPAGSLDELLGEVAIFDSHVEKNILLVEVVGVAAADGDFQAEEMQVIEAICDVLAIDKGKIDRCKAFARRAIDLMDEGKSLVAEV